MILFNETDYWLISRYAVKLVLESISAFKQDLWVHKVRQKEADKATKNSIILDFSLLFILSQGKSKSHFFQPENVYIKIKLDFSFFRCSCEERDKICQSLSPATFWTDETWQLGPDGGWLRTRTTPRPRSCRCLSGSRVRSSKASAAAPENSTFRQVWLFFVTPYLTFKFDISDIFITLFWFYKYSGLLLPQVAQLRLTFYFCYNFRSAGSQFFRTTLFLRREKKNW